MATVDTLDQTTELALIHEKLDYLTEQFEAQRKRQEAFDELKDDLLPIGNQLIKLTIDELAEIGNEFELEDLLFLLKRLLRDTHLLLHTLDRLEAAMGLVDEVETLGKQAFSNLVEQLDQLERAGYFNFAREGMQVVDRIVAEFSEEDVRALGDNVVTILKTVRNMTQPDMMALANNAVDAIRNAPEEESNISVLALLRESRDPKVRRGMARMLNLLKTIADQPNGVPQN